MRAQWVRWVAFAAVVIVVIVAVSVAMVAFGGRAVRIDYYRVVGDRELVIGVTGGKGSWPRAHVDEDQASVTITASLVDWSLGLPQTAVGIPLELPVTLDGPLAERIVRDGSNGEEAVRTRCEWPIYLAPGCRVEQGATASGSVEVSR
jgi:hypothetical protein